MFGLSRGERNNNPFNIRISTIPWRGKLTPSKDKQFEQFDTPYNGIRAAAKNLLSYYQLHGLQTVAGIIARHAPASENDLAAYTDFVCKSLSVGPHDHLNLLDPQILGRLIEIIIEFECGKQSYPESQIDQVVDEVLTIKPVIA